MKHIFCKLIACMAMILMTAPLLAQDIIVTTDAKMIEAKIMEVSKTEIKYKESDNLEGPTFVLSVDEISSIIYSNGKVVLYNQDSQQPQNEINQYIATIFLRSGYTITGEIVEMNNDHVSYMENGLIKTILASEISKVTLSNGQTKEYTNVQIPQSVVSQTVTPQTQSVQTEASQKGSGRIYRDNGHYMHNDVYISGREVERILKKESPSAYRQWQKAGGLAIGGGVCLGIGTGLAIGCLCTSIGSLMNLTPTIALGCTAIVPLGIGIGLCAGSTSAYNKAINIHNSKYDQASLQLRFGVSANGVGVALAF